MNKAAVKAEGNRILREWEREAKILGIDLRFALRNEVFQLALVNGCSVGMAYELTHRPSYVTQLPATGLNANQHTQILSLQIENRRRELGISQRKLAELTGLSNATISRIESGKVVPDFKSALVIMEYLGYKLHWEDMLP
jgi:DNA-binding XRE family transcriptional regulator